jgi:hypothetical protein
MTSRAFWEIAERMQIPAADALELIGYPGKIGASGKRPRFRLSTRQTRLAAYLPEIEAALHAIGERQPGCNGATGPRRSRVERRWRG